MNHCATLQGVLPKDYSHPGLDKQHLGQIINLVSDIALGSAADRARDTLANGSISSSPLGEGELSKHGTLAATLAKSECHERVA